MQQLREIIRLIWLAWVFDKLFSLLAPKGAPREANARMERVNETLRWVAANVAMLGRPPAHQERGEGNPTLCAKIRSVKKMGRYVRGSFSVSIVLVVLAVIFLMPAIGQAQPVEGERQTWLVALQGEVTAASTDKIEIAAGSHGIAFTDRPERKVALVNLADLVKTLWGKDGEFVADPPNASVVDESKGLIAVVEITNADWREGALRLEITRLDGRLPAAGDYVAFTIDAYAGQSIGTTRLIP